MERSSTKETIDVAMRDSLSSDSGSAGTVPTTSTNVSLDSIPQIKLEQDTNLLSAATVSVMPTISSSLSAAPAISLPAPAAPRPPGSSTSKVAQIANQAVHKLPYVDFPSPETRSSLQPDDLADTLLLMIGTALACVDNRALCPKEIADVCIKNGWICTGSQPFAIVSTCIRAHLRRRGINTNSSTGRAISSNHAPPLFTSYELTGPVHPLDAAAMGIESEAKLAVKRGTLWYLSDEGAGFPSPFGERDPNLPHNQTPELLAYKNNSKSALRRSSMPGSVSLPNLPFIKAPSPSNSPEDEYGPDGEALGRGKRKRKASSIAGGDSSWHSGDKKSGSAVLEPVQEKPIPVPAAPASSPSPHKRAGSVDSSFRYPVAPSAMLERASGIKRIKLRLSSLAETAAESSATDLSDSDAPDASFAAAQERRRMKKRSKSDGSLLLLEPAAMHYRPPAGSDIASIEPSSPTSHSIPELDHSHQRAWSAEPPHSVMLGTLVGRRLLRDDIEMRNPEDTDDEDDDDFHEAMLRGDVDFDFEGMGKRPRCAIDDLLEADLVQEMDTPATTAGSPDPVVEGDDFYDLAKEAAAQLANSNELILLGLDENRAMDTLAEEARAEANLVDEQSTQAEFTSSSLPLPALPIVTAANTPGFAPAGGASHETEDIDDELSLASSVSDLGTLQDGFGSRLRRSFSPASSLDSSYSATPNSEHSRAVSPGACSSVDSFDAEIVIGGVQRRLSEEVHSAFSPSILALEDLVTVEEAQGEEDLEVAKHDFVITELDLEFPESRCKTTEIIVPPTPFGPEVYGFVEAPSMDWHPASDIISPTCEEADKEKSLELISEDVEMDSEPSSPNKMAFQNVSSPAPLPPSTTTADELPPPSISKPVLQRKLSASQAPGEKLTVSTGIENKAVTSTRSAQIVEAEGTATPSLKKKPAPRRSSRKSGR